MGPLEICKKGKDHPHNRKNISLSLSGYVFMGTRSWINKPPSANLSGFVHLAAERDVKPQSTGLRLNPKYTVWSPSVVPRMVERESARSVYRRSDVVPVSVLHPIQLQNNLSTCGWVVGTSCEIFYEPPIYITRPQEALHLRHCSRNRYIPHLQRGIGIPCYGKEFWFDNRTEVLDFVL